MKKCPFFVWEFDIPQVTQISSPPPLQTVYLWPNEIPYVVLFFPFYKN
jgi:hypothetical protein